MCTSPTAWVTWFWEPWCHCQLYATGLQITLFCFPFVWDLGLWEGPGALSCLVVLALAEIWRSSSFSLFMLCCSSQFQANGNSCLEHDIYPLPLKICSMYMMPLSVFFLYIILMWYLLCARHNVIYYSAVPPQLSEVGTIGFFHFTDEKTEA
jgi:hypothetical protein